MATTSHLKRDFECTLTDLSPAMLEVSRGINPECEHLAGDMRMLRLGHDGRGRSPSILTMA